MGGLDQEMSLRCRIGLHAFDRLGEPVNPKVKAWGVGKEGEKKFELKSVLVRCRRCKHTEIWLE